MFTLRTLLEGKWPILVFTLLTVASLFLNRGRFLCWLLTGISFALLAFVISFFRDPEVNVPADEKSIVAPASGKICEIATVKEPNYLNAEATRIAIFLSIFDVHVQRSPMAGTIKAVGYQPGKFLDVRNPQASALNEFRWLGLESADGYRVTVRQIAGLIARRIVGWTDKGATLAKAERFGMIKFGSRVEIYLPPGTEIVAKVGDYAKGGETILARRP